MRRAHCSLIFLLVTIAFLPATLAQGRASFAIIVNEENPISTATQATVSHLFLKKVTRWEDGTPVTPVNLPTDSDVRDSFSRSVHRRSAANIEAYWQRQIFSGRDLPPTSRSNEEAVVAYVRQHRGAIAYVSTRTRLEGVKILTLRDAD